MQRELPTAVGWRGNNSTETISPCIQRSAHIESDIKVIRLRCKDYDKAVGVISRDSPTSGPILVLMSSSISPYFRTSEADYLLNSTVWAFLRQPLLWLYRGLLYTKHLPSLDITSNWSGLNDVEFRFHKTPFDILWIAE